MCGRVCCTATCFTDWSPVAGSASDTRRSAWRYAPGCACSKRRTRNRGNARSAGPRRQREMSLYLLRHPFHRCQSDPAQRRPRLERPAIRMSAGSRNRQENDHEQGHGVRCSPGTARRELSIGVKGTTGMSAISTEDTATIRRLRSQCSDWQMIRCPAGCLCSWKPGHAPIPEEQISAKTSVEMPTGECDGGEVVLIRD